MTEHTRCINIDDERLLASARAWAEAFPEYAQIVARLEARLLAETPTDPEPRARRTASETICY